MDVFSCNAPYREGGLGWHLATLVEDARERNDLLSYFATVKKPNDPAGYEVDLSSYRWMFRSLPLSRRHGWRDFLAAELFDRMVARKLQSADRFIGFTGRAHHTFKRARDLRYEQLILESATSHVANVRRKHQFAHKRYPIEESWLNNAQYKKILKEYAAADLIYVSSKYAWQTFIEAGIPENKLRRRVVNIASRFSPARMRVASDAFRIVYVGRLQVSKGIPVLIDAFKLLDNSKAELVLVGGTATVEMDRYLRRQIARDPRIKITFGDPLSHYHKADVLVHPTFEDALALAPLEALACGVPVLVTEDTGMKEYVVNSKNGYVLPTANVDALVDRLKEMSSYPLKDKFDPLCII